MFKKILTFALVALLSMLAYAAELTIMWDMPVSNIDGSELIDLAGAKIYWGTSTSNYTSVVDVGMVTGYTLTNLIEGVTYYINGTAYNTYGNESDFCIEIVKTVWDGPSNPVYLRIVGIKKE